ncbi:hypothetical protein HYDPIDRAFT_110003 [Hydnomerulius pinastri MD-312]|nr:hypothetical protein HYDPIDRAFT_110003 [Hydnomerulius pinastri MD-312]
MQEWEKEEWGGCYHRCGIINIGDGHKDKSLENDIASGATVDHLDDGPAIRSKLLQFLPRDPNPSLAEDPFDNFAGYSGYFNPDGGWAEAARAVTLALSRVRALGGKVWTGKEVVSLIKDENQRTLGVRCKDGEVRQEYRADRVVLAVGSWTASAFPGLEVDQKCLATGQSVAMIQLDEEEAARYNNLPVVLDFRTGFYVFPPTADRIVKFAIHAAGHTHMVVPSIPESESSGSSSPLSSPTPPRKISTPRTITSHPADGLQVPRDALLMLRRQLGRVLPELAKKPWAGTRMCWYTDSPDGDWVIGPYPGDPGLFLATSGSGHAFKFLPNIGRLVADALEGTLDPSTAARFAVDRDVAGATNGERSTHIPEELPLDQLCGAGDGDI